jgi:hypothetical protein
MSRKRKKSGLPKGPSSQPSQKSWNLPAETKIQTPEEAIADTPYAGMKTGLAHKTTGDKEKDAANDVRNTAIHFGFRGL